MPVPRARQITLTATERRKLKALAYSHTAGYQQVIRARIIRDAAHGYSNAKIAGRHGAAPSTPCAAGAAGSPTTACPAWPTGNAPGARPGSPRAGRRGQGAGLPASGRDRGAAVALVCPELAARGRRPGHRRRRSRRPRSRRIWPPTRSSPGSTGPGSSSATRTSPPRPTACSTCTPAPARAIAARRRRVRDLQRREDLASRPAAAATPPSPPAQARAMRVNHEYDRGGALAYLAAYDVHQARVFGRCEATTGIVPFMALVDQVMTQEPYAIAKRVFWVVDNGSSHRGKAAIDRLASGFPNAVMVHTPVHASWLNQVEIFFSDRPAQSRHTQRLHRPGPGPGPAHEPSKHRYNATAQPFSGGSPPPTWTICWPGSTDTNRKSRTSSNPPAATPACRTRPGRMINPRRTYGARPLSNGTQRPKTARHPRSPGPGSNP